MMVAQGSSDFAVRVQWIEVLPKVGLGPNSRHLFRIPPSAGVNYVKLNMYPDGGIVSVSLLLPHFTSSSKLKIFSCSTVGPLPSVWDCDAGFSSANRCRI